MRPMSSGCVLETVLIYPCGTVAPDGAAPGTAQTTKRGTAMKRLIVVVLLMLLALLLRGDSRF